MTWEKKVPVNPMELFFFIFAKLTKIGHFPRRTYAPACGNLTGARYRDEIFRRIASPNSGAVGSGFLQVHGNAWPHVARVWFLEDEGINWPARSPDLNPIQHLWDFMDQRIRWLPNPPGQFRSSPTPWMRSGRKTILGKSVGLSL